MCGSPLLSIRLHSYSSDVGYYIIKDDDESLWFRVIVEGSIKSFLGVGILFFSFLKQKYC